MITKIKTMILTGFLSISIQAMETEIQHPFKATDGQIKNYDYDPKPLYMDPIKLVFIVEGDALRDQTIRITCSDARSVLLPHNGKFCEETYAVMSKENMETLEKQKYVTYGNLLNCYDIFKVPGKFKDMDFDKTSGLVKTYNFGNAKNLNGVSMKIEETENQDIWAYGRDWNEWYAAFDFYPWSPGVIIYEEGGCKNEPSLLFEIKGYIDGKPYPKFLDIHPYLKLVESTKNFQESLGYWRGFATICYGEQLIENAYNHYAQLFHSLQGSNQKETRKKSSSF